MTGLRYLSEKRTLASLVVFCRYTDILDFSIATENKPEVCVDSADRNSTHTTEKNDDDRKLPVMGNSLE